MILVWLKLFLLFWRIFEALMIIQTQLSSYWTLLVYFFPNKFFNFLRKSLIFPKSSDSTKKNLHVFLLIGTKTWFNRRGDISLYLEMCCGSAFDGAAVMSGCLSGVEGVGYSCSDNSLLVPQSLSRCSVCRDCIN